MVPPFPPLMRPRFALALLLHLAARAAANSPVGRLVVHAGPHKTGSTSVQQFLSEQRAYLDAAHGIRVAASDTPTTKDGAVIATFYRKTADGVAALSGHLDNATRARWLVAEACRDDDVSHEDLVSSPRRYHRLGARRLVAETGAALRGRALVLLSAEAFSLFSLAAWRAFLADVDAAAGAPVEVAVAVAHRDTASRLISTWVEFFGALAGAWRLLLTGLERRC